MLEVYKPSPLLYKQSHCTLLSDSSSKVVCTEPESKPKGLVSKPMPLTITWHPFSWMQALPSIISLAGKELYTDLSCRCPQLNGDTPREVWSCKFLLILAGGTCWRVSLDSGEADSSLEGGDASSHCIKMMPQDHRYKTWWRCHMSHKQLILDLLVIWDTITFDGDGISFIFMVMCFFFLLLYQSSHPSVVLMDAEFDKSFGCLRTHFINHKTAHVL